MQRVPYIVCHMVTSIDGKVTGEFLRRHECSAATEIYYRKNRSYKKSGFNGFICGRVTMEESFTGGFRPDLSGYREIAKNENYIPENLSGFYAVAFDPKGKLGWKANTIIDPDGDPGYDGAQIIEVLTEQVDGRYLDYLRKTDVAYVIAGKDSIDVGYALNFLCENFGAEKLLLEGGSVVNGYFLNDGFVDELSLVQAPVIADSDGKPLFTGAAVTDFVLSKVTQYKNGVLWLNYKK